MLNKRLKLINRRVKGLLKRKKRFLEVHLVEHCNLNCKSCAHFSPIAEPFCIEIDDLEKMYKNLQPIYDDFFGSIHLMGGEPLLHPEIEDIISLTRKYFPRTEIQIVTNGIKMLGMKESFWKSCQQNEVIFSISQYPIAVDYKKLFDKLTEYDIRFVNSGKINYFLNYCLDSTGKQEPLESYSKCIYGGYCIQLKDNKLFTCFQSAYINHINKYFNKNFVYQNGDFLSLDKPISKRIFKKFISTPVPFCRYCDMNKQCHINWDFSKKEQDEWIMTENKYDDKL